MGLLLPISNKWYSVINKYIKHLFSCNNILYLQPGLSNTDQNIIIKQCLYQTHINLFEMFYKVNLPTPLPCNQAFKNLV